MSASVAQARLKDALRDLKLRLERAKLDWDDHARREFEETYIRPLEGQVLAALTAMARMGEVCAAAHRDCSGEGS